MRRKRKPPSKAKQIRQLQEKCNSHMNVINAQTKTFKFQQQKIQELEDRVSKLNAELYHNAKNAAIIRELIAKATHVDFFRVPGNRETYRCQVDFDGRFMGLLHSRPEQEFVADDVAEQIRREIINSKFINTANNNRRRELDEEMGLRSQRGRPF
jgi:hypothetical protein